MNFTIRQTATKFVVEIVKRKLLL